MAAAARARHDRTPRPRHPLEGVQVVDPGKFLAGPFGPMLLGDLGADVVKVEPPAAKACAASSGRSSAVSGKRSVAHRLQVIDELNSRANRLARHLLSLGIGAESRITVCLEPGLEIMVALLAVLEAGAVYVPLEPSYPQRPGASDSRRYSSGSSSSLKRISRKGSP